MTDHKFVPTYTLIVSGQTKTVVEKQNYDEAVNRVAELEKENAQLKADLDAIFKAENGG